MVRLRTLSNSIKYILVSAVIYFCFDYFVQLTHFLKCYSFVGLKSFLPLTLGLNFGIYGVIGELIAVRVTTLLLNRSTAFYMQEVVIVVVFGIGSWFLWHLQSYTHRIHFKFASNFIRYILLSVFLSLISGVIAIKLINFIAFEEVLIWNIALDIVIGIPVNIIYAGLMNLDPVLPPIYKNGKRIQPKNDVIYTVDKTTESFQALTYMIESALDNDNTDVKKKFIILNLVEEMYLRIINCFPDAVIDVKANLDIVFSIQFIYIGKKFNPFILRKDEEEDSLAGLKIIKHRALLAFYNYTYGENKVHIVI